MTRKYKIELIFISFLIAISMFAHGYNMFQYPYYENDEGTYMSQAVAVTEQAKLAPYTYWYDHAPGGWFFIAIWAKLTGGYFSFGDSINTGRVLMLLVHVVTTLLLYGILRRTVCNRVYSLVGALLFAVSPLAIEIGRRVLLDPIMIMWVLASVFTIVGEHRKLRHFFLSAIFFAFAVLTKEPAIFFLPALLYTVYTGADLSHRRVVIVKWVTVFSILVSLYPVYALMKGEFFPYGSSLGGSSPHVSLLETLKYQADRKTDGNFWDLNGGFQFYFHAWTNGNHDLMLIGDPVLMLGGLTATIAVLILSLWVRRVRVMAILTLCYWIFLIRGGVIIQFYILPLLPLMAGCIAIVAQEIARLKKRKYSYVLQTSILLLIIIPTSLIYFKRTAIYTQNQTTPQIQALEWVQKNIPNDAVLLIDNYAYVDITYNYPKANYYWKAEVDPEIHDGLLKGKWYNIDYILSTGQIEQDVARVGFVLVGDAMKNSVPLATFERDGYAVTIRKVIKSVAQPVAVNAWHYYANTFLSDGRAFDPYTQNRTTSEGQSYLLLRAVWNNDKTTFDSGWNWTKQNLQKRSNDSLLAWLWSNDNGKTYRVSDLETASDADQDTALALLFAYKKWGNTEYLKEAKEIINDIWKFEVVKVKNNNYLVANTNSLRDNTYLLNPSYLSPATYRIFAEVDLTHDWMSVVDSSYQLLDKISVNSKGNLQLPSDWIMIDRNSGITSSATKYTSKTADQYGYDAFRVMWRIALDAKWNKEPRAEIYLNKYNAFFNNQFYNHKLVSIYSNEGQPISSEGNISTDIGALSVFDITDKNVAENFYQARIASTYNQEGYWEARDNYYGQNWAWFGTAFHKDVLINLWNNK